MAKYMSIPYEAALRTYDTSIRVLFPTVCSPKISKIKFNAMGIEKKLPRNKVFDFSIMKSLATK
jgi:hypothetical protein